MVAPATTWKTYPTIIITKSTYTIHGLIFDCIWEMNGNVRICPMAKHRLLLLSDIQQTWNIPPCVHHKAMISTIQSNAGASSVQGSQHETWTVFCAEFVHGRNTLLGWLCSVNTAKAMTLGFQIWFDDIEKLGVGKEKKTVSKIIIPPTNNQKTVKSPHLGKLRENHPAFITLLDKEGIMQD